MMMKTEKERFLAIANQIAQIAQEIAKSEEESHGANKVPTRAQLYREANSQFRNFKARIKHLPMVPTHDPGLTILLELFLVGEKNRKLSVTAIGLDQALPMATLIRWLSVLCDSGLAKREPDEKDRRRVWMSLTALGQEKVCDYLKDCLDDEDRVEKAA